MVSYIPYGRLGNALFMASNCISYALKHGLEFSIPNISSDSYWNPTPLSHLHNKNWNPSLEIIKIDEPYFHYTEPPFEESWREKNIVFNGYFQSYKYVNEYRDEILKLFSYHWELKQEFVSCHIRRGDYVYLRDKHPGITVEWYEQAMGMFPGKKFLFFSDDIKYCKDNFGHRNDCFFSEGKSIEEDLIAASCCGSNICSASTYSFWIYYLNRNENKKGIFPKLWFTQGWGNADTKDILPPEVIRL